VENSVVSRQLILNEEASVCTADASSRKVASISRRCHAIRLLVKDRCAQKQLLEHLDAIAADQGSSDASVVLKNYLSETERRQYRREYMRDRLAEAFKSK